MWDLSSQTRDLTHIPCIEDGFLTTGPPEKSKGIWGKKKKKHLNYILSTKKKNKYINMDVLVRIYFNLGHEIVQEAT